MAIATAARQRLMSCAWLLLVKRTPSDPRGWVPSMWGWGQMYKPLFELFPSSVLPSPPSPLFHSLPLFLLPLPSLPPLLPLLCLQRKRLHKSSAMTDALYHKSPGGVKAQRAVEGEKSKTESRSQSEMLRLQRTSQHIDTLLTDQH